MRKLVTWVLVTLGIAALVRKWRKRSAGAGVPEPGEAAADETGSDPADALREKLAESRAADDAAASGEAPEAGVDERRAAVHDEGRAALDEMQSTTDD